jgi:hypothetical protein
MSSVFVTAQLRPDAADELRRGAPRSKAAAEVARVVEARGLELRPVLPTRSGPPDLVPTFVVEAPDETVAEDLRDALEGLDAVEGAYVKPPDELP